MYIPTSLVVVAAEATDSDEDVKVANSKEVEGGKGAIGSLDGYG